MHASNTRAAAGVPYRGLPAHRNDLCMSTHHDERSACGCGAAPGVCREPGVVRAAVALLDQCTAFIAGVSDGVYTAESATIRGGSIGKHIRHVLDHFDAILVGVEAAAVIDYDHRERDVPMESRRPLALEGVERTRRRVASLTPSQLCGPARIRIMLAAGGDQAELGTTIARELAFATHHAVHHQAMMKAIAAEHGLAAAAEFGRAASTLHHDHRHDHGAAVAVGVAPALEGPTG